MIDTAHPPDTMTLPSEAAAPIHLHSSIAEDYRQEIEDLFFFNPKQAVVRERVRQHIDRYGTPEIRCHDGMASLGLSRVDQAQTLFILAGGGRAKLLGVLLYIREEDCLRVLYLALAPECTTDWGTSCPVISCVFDQLRRLARNIKGVQHVEFSLARGDLTVRV